MKVFRTRPFDSRSVCADHIISTQRSSLLERILSLGAGQRLEKSSAEVRFVLLQRQLAEVRFEMLLPNLLIATNRRSLLAWFARELDDLFAVRQVALFPELRDRHVLFGHRCRV